MGYYWLLVWAKAIFNFYQPSYVSESQLFGIINAGNWGFSLSHNVVVIDVVGQQADFYMLQVRQYVCLRFKKGKKISFIFASISLFRTK